MTVSNFKLTNRFGTSPITWSFRGTVECTKKVGFLFWKRTIVETKEIYKNYGEKWYWSDIGTYAGSDVEHAVRVWEAHNECKIEDYVFADAEK